MDFAVNHMFNPEGKDPPADNTNLPVGYTYFGQFIDHDITFDPISDLMMQHDPDQLHNFRTPRFDLDSVYGKGPKGGPEYFFDTTKRGRGGFAGFLLTGTGENPGEPDLQRNIQGTAIIGDPRNDENVIVSQVHLAFIRLHNIVLESVAGSTAASEEHFHEAQRIVRWFYQYVVWNDFIKRLVSDSVWKEALKFDGSHWNANTEIYNPKQNPFMPVEFSVAAFRFAHSMVRPGYQINNFTDLGDGGPTGFGLSLPVFDPSRTGQPDLRGGQKLKRTHTIQWDWYNKFPSSRGPFPQAAQLIDRTLSRGVFQIPGEGNQTNPLAFLNIMRGWRLQVPSGPAVAEHLSIKPITLEHEHENALWVYILREAGKLPGPNAGKMLGPVGGRIVADVFAGLLAKDKLSYVNMKPKWTPADETHLPFKKPINGDDWEFADIIRAAGMPISGDDIEAMLAGS